MPERVRAAIASQALKNAQSIADYLDTCAKCWQPKFPLSQVADACLQDAMKLREAVLPSLQRRKSKVLEPGDRARLGLADYERVFGYAITARHWQRLIDRTIWRNRDAEDFERLELYLPENPKQKTNAARLLPQEAEFAELRATIRSFTNEATPTGAEKAALWAQAFELLANAGAKREIRTQRRQLVRFLFRHAPTLAANEHALRVSFDRKYARWQEGAKSPAALLDGREAKSGAAHAQPIPQDDLDRIIGEAAFACGGRVRQAARQLAEQGEASGLSPETLDLISRPASRKSYLNARVADAVKHDVRMVRPYLLGRQAIDDATAHIERDYSKLVSMQIVCADDFTWPVYFYLPDGNGWYVLTRGQCLLFIDVRSWKIIAWSLQPERNYNSLVIRTLMNRVCGEFGLPGAWYYERGIWESAHAVKRAAPIGWHDALSLPECKTGWEQIGVRFQHAIRARSKPVERVGGLLQDLMEGERGYCGRDERRDLPAATKQAMEDVRAERVNPSELFPSFDEWETTIGNLIEAYNASVQDGKVLGGASPNEMFEARWPHDNPPAKFDATCWHLVAHYVKELPVTTNGISFRIGKQNFIYRNERTGQDRGQHVLAWFDPECPELLCVTDLKRRNPYLVERSRPVDFLAAADDPAFERELASAAAHSAYPKARFNVLKSKFQTTFRRNVVDVETADLAREIREQREVKTVERKQQDAQSARAHREYGRLGMAMPSADRRGPEQIEAAHKLRRLLSEDDAAPATTEGGV